MQRALCLFVAAAVGSLCWVCSARESVCGVDQSDGVVVFERV